MAEVAQLLKLNEQTIRNMIDRGELPAVRVGQRRLRIRQSALDAFLAEGETATQEAEADPSETDPWQAVSEAGAAVKAAAQEQDRDALEKAVSALTEASRAL